MAAAHMMTDTPPTARRGRGRPRQHPDLAKRPVALRLDNQLRLLMVEHRARSGMTLSDQLRSAIGEWLAVHAKQPPYRGAEQKIPSALRG